MCCVSHLFLHSVEEVCEAFRKASFHEVKHISNLGGSTFCRDPLCPDTLVFSQQLYALVQFSSPTGSSVLQTQVTWHMCVTVSYLLWPQIHKNSACMNIVWTCACPSAGQECVCGGKRVAPSAVWEERCPGSRNLLGSHSSSDSCRCCRQVQPSAAVWFWSHTFPYQRDDRALHTNEHQK